MYIIRNILKLIFVYCPIIILVIGIGFYTQNKFNYILKNLAPIVSEAATEYIGSEAKVESVKFKGFSVILHNISLKDPQENFLASCENLSIKLNPITFSAKTFAILTVHADKINADIERKNNVWNFEFLTKLFKKKNITPTDIRGPVILITNTKINFSDDISGYTDNFDNINLRMDLKSQNNPKISLFFSSDYIEKIYFHTIFNVSEHRAIINADLSKLNLSAFNKYKYLLPNGTIPKGINIQDVYGLTDAKLYYNVQNSQVKDFNLQTYTKSLYAKTNYGSLSNTKLNLNIDQEYLYLNTKCHYNNTPLFAKGNLNLKTKEITGSLSVKNANLSDYTYILPKDYRNITGNASIFANIKGLLNAPTVYLNLTGNNLSYSNINLNKINLKGNYKNNNFEYELYAEKNGKHINSPLILKKLKGTQGKLFAKGIISIPDIKKINISKISTNSLINIRDINLNFFTPFNGKLEGDFLVKGAITSPKITSNIALSKGILNLNKVKFNNLEINLSASATKEKVNITGGLIKGVYNTAILFSGEIDKKLTGSVNISLDQLDLSNIAKDFNINLSGKVNLGSKITRQANEIKSENKINIADFQYEGQHFDFAQANFSLSPYAIYINKCDILDLPASVHLSGLLTPNKEFLTEIEQENELVLEKSTDIKINPKNINTKKSKNIFTMFTGNSKLYFAGKINADNFSTKNIFKRFKIQNDNIKAIAQCNMYVTGAYSKNKLTDLSGEGEINIDTLMAYKYPFNNVFAKILIDDNIISIKDIKGDAVSYNVTDSSYFGTVQGEGSYNLSTGEILGDISLNNINIGDFKEYYQNYITIFGMMNSKCKIYGVANKNTKDINCSLINEIPILSINGKTYRNVKITGDLVNSDLISGEAIISKDEQNLQINLENYSIKNKEIENLSLNAKDLSINELREIFYLSPFSKQKSIAKVLTYIPTISNGDINIFLSLSGDIKSLDGECEISGKDINADFDKLSHIYAKLTAEKGIINLDNLNLEGTEFVLTCDAYPLFDTKVAFNSQDVNKLLVKESNINLNIANLPLSRFGKYMNLPDIEGNLACDAIITGDLSKPNITASLSVDKPIISNIAMNSLKAPKINVSKDEIDISQGITLHLTEKNYATIKGKIPMSFISTNDSNDQINLSLDIPQQNLEFIETLSPIFTKDTTKGTFVAQATLKGNASHPILSGSANISEGKIHTLGNTTLNNVNSDISFTNDENGDLILNLKSLTLDDNKNNKFAFIADKGYIKVKTKYNILQEREQERLNRLKETQNQRQVNRRNISRTENITLGDILKESEINLVCIFNNFAYSCKDFSPYSDNTTCEINGKITVDGNLSSPNIYSEDPILLNKVVCYCKAGKNEETADQNAILTLANKKIKKDDILSYSDAINYEEMFTPLNINEISKTVSFNPSFNINILAKNAEIHPPATIVKADLEADIKGNLSNPSIKGTAKVKDGRTSFQIARARLVKDSYINFEYSNGTPSADINLEAFSFVHAADKTGNDERYKINITIAGTLDNYDINLESDPEGLTEKEIIQAFTGINANSINAGDTLAKIGATNILSPIEDFFVEQLGFDSLGFEYSQNKYAIINIERSFSKKLYGSFYSNLYNPTKAANLNNNNTSAWEVKFGYKFNKLFRANIGINDRNEKSLDFSYGFRF